MSEMPLHRNTRAPPKQNPQRGRSGNLTTPNEATRHRGLQKFCTNCGNKLSAEGSFCTECGGPLEHLALVKADQEQSAVQSTRAEGSPRELKRTRDVSELCQRCGAKIQSSEMFCGSCGDGRSIIRKLGKISPSEVLSHGLVDEIQINDERSPLRALSKNSPWTSDNMIDFQEGLLFMLRWGIAFSPHKDHNDRNRLIRHAALHVMAHAIPYSGLVVPTALRLAQNSRGECDRRDKVQKMISDPGLFSRPGAYIIPFNEVSEIKFRQSALDSQRYFLLITSRGTQGVTHHIISPEGYGKSGYVIACALTNWASGLFSMCLDAKLGKIKQLARTFSTFYDRQATIQYAIFQKHRS